MPDTTRPDYDVVKLIRSVNYFVAVGEVRARNAIQMYAMTANQSQEPRLNALVRLLFGPSVGAVDPRDYWYWVVGDQDAADEEIDYSAFPTFPFLVVHDMPFQVGYGWRGKGERERLAPWLAAVLSATEFRKHFLRPAGRMTVAAAEAVEKLTHDWPIASGLSQTSTAGGLETVKWYVEQQFRATVRGATQAATAGPRTELRWDASTQSFLASEK